jgi:hypothetical protein
MNHAACKLGDGPEQRKLWQARSIHRRRVARCRTAAAVKLVSCIVL